MFIAWMRGRFVPAGVSPAVDAPVKAASFDNRAKPSESPGGCPMRRRCHLPAWANCLFGGARRTESCGRDAHTDGRRDAGRYVCPRGLSQAKADVVCPP